MKCLELVPDHPLLARGSPAPSTHRGKESTGAGHNLRVDPAEHVILEDRGEGLVIVDLLEYLPIRGEHHPPRPCRHPTPLSVGSLCPTGAPPPGLWDAKTISCPTNSVVGHRCPTTARGMVCAYSGIRNERFVYRIGVLIYAKPFADIRIFTTDPPR